MEGFLVSAATGALSPVLGKLTSLLSGEYTRFKRVRREVRSLTDELAAMHAFLLKMSEDESPDAQDAAWMKEVREISYDIEDSLDDFMVHVDGGGPTKPDGFMNKIKILLEKTKNRRRIAKAIQDLKVQVKQAGDRHARYRNGHAFSTGASRASAVDQRALAIFEDVSQLVGTDGPMKEVIQLLRGDGGHLPLHRPKVVSIVGPAGLGKTTIARQVYQELKGRYECVSFVTVSRTLILKRF